jgi:hypothetical protein
MGNTYHSNTMPTNIVFAVHVDKKSFRSQSFLDVIPDHAPHESPVPVYYMLHEPAQHCKATDAIISIRLEGITMRVKHRMVDNCAVSRTFPSRFRARMK